MAVEWPRSERGYLNNESRPSCTWNSSKTGEGRPETFPLIKKKAEGFHLWLQSDPLFPDLPGRCPPMTLECRAGEANSLIEIGAQLGDPAYSHPQASSGGKHSKPAPKKDRDHRGLPPTFGTCLFLSFPSGRGLVLDT